MWGFVSPDAVADLIVGHDVVDGLTLLRSEDVDGVERPGGVSGLVTSACFFECPDEPARDAVAE